MGLTPHSCHFCGTWKPDVLSQLLRESNRDKTVTARHRESSDREVERSECCTVMVQIAVEILLQAKAVLTFNWCFMARKHYRTCKWKKANERGRDFIVCTTTSD